MKSNRVLVISSALVACVIFIESTLLTVYGYLFNVASASAFDAAPGNAQNSAEILPFIPGILVGDLIVAAAFGVGVLISLRFVRSVAANLTWKRVVLRGIIATAIGAVAVLAVRIVESLLTSVQIGPYPLGYSFTSSFDPGNVQLGLANALGQLLNPFVEYAPLVVLACVFLKLWQARVPGVEPLLTNSEPAKGRASASA